SRMLPAVLLSVVSALLVGFLRPAAYSVAFVFLAAWFFSPALALRVSLPPAKQEEPLPETDAKFLRSIARRTWRYFDTFAAAAENALPPDNFQETPQPVVAHRPPPTNGGLFLLSTVAANDFGWIGTEEMLERLEATFASIARL